MRFRKTCGIRAHEKGTHRTRVKNKACAERAYGRVCPWGCAIAACLQRQKTGFIKRQANIVRIKYRADQSISPWWYYKIRMLYPLITASKPLLKMRSRRPYTIKISQNKPFLWCKSYIFRIFLRVDADYIDLPKHISRHGRVWALVAENMS